MQEENGHKVPLMYEKLLVTDDCWEREPAYHLNYVAPWKAPCDPVDGPTTMLIPATLNRLHTLFVLMTFRKNSNEIWKE